jgi:hypothetical protein
MATLAARACLLAAFLAGPCAAEEPPPAQAAEAHADPASVTVDIGGRAIVLPGPTGWVELTTNRQAVRTLFEASLPKENRHLATFVSPDQAAGVDGGNGMTHWATALTLRQLESHDMTAAEYAMFQDTMRSEWDRVLAIARERLGKELEGGSARVREQLDVDLEMKVGKLDSAGMFLDEPGALGTLLLADSEVSAGEESRSATIAMAMVMLYVEPRLLMLNVYRERNDDSDLEAAKAVALQWKDAVRAANTVPAP